MKTPKQYFALQTEFFASVNGKMMPDLPGYPPDHKGERYSITMNTCIECYLEKGWSQKLGELLVRHGIDLDKFVASTKMKHIDFSVQDGKLEYEKCRCPTILEVFSIIADLMSE